MPALRDEVRTLIRDELSTYDSEKSHRRRNEDLYDYTVEDGEVTVSMEAGESGGAYMMPGLLQRLTWTLTPECTDVEYVEDKRTGTRADGTTPNKRIDVTIYLRRASDEELKNLRSHLR